MFIKWSETNQKKVWPMIINEYKINSQFSGALIEIDGDHWELKCLNEDRIYFIISWNWKFILDSVEKDIRGSDLIFVPKETPYNIIWKMKYFLVCSPEFDPKDDVFL